MIYHHNLLNVSREKDSYIWEEETSTPFHELIISWNAKRPQTGLFTLSISLKINEDWSPWLLYASWGNKGQSGGNEKNSHIHVNEDIVKVINGVCAFGFRVRIQTLHGADLNHFFSLHANTHMDSSSTFFHLNPIVNSIEIPIPLLSQMKLNHPHHRSMCSATSTAAVIGHLSGNFIDPIDFALHSYDNVSAIFGNWVLNVAQASTILGKQWQCWVQRLTGFEDLYTQLEVGMPVVVSVKGPLLGSALPYNEGHLMVVKGYCAKENRVLCMDPAFPENETTNVSYDRHEFMQAWSRRHYIAYVFKKR